MTFFNNCNTVDDVKQLYKKLAKENHPDLGGDLETMQKINTEYAFAIAKLLAGENLTNEEINDKINLNEQYRSIIEQIISLPGIQVELMGYWVWVTGDTFPVKDKLKAVGLFFASKKKAWYYRSEEYKTNNRKQTTLAEIRNKYGSTVLSSSTQFSKKSLIHN